MEQIQVNLIFFGSLKSYFGEKLQILVTKGINLNGIINVLIDNKPEATDILNTSLLAIDSELQNKEYKIYETVEIAVLPPFSGG